MIDSPLPLQNTSTSPQIRDVAVLAQVSTATVSRFLSKPQTVSAKKRESVRLAIETLGYIPSAAARNLRAGKSNTVLVITSERNSPPFFADVLRGIETELSVNGFAVIMTNMHGDPELRRRSIELAHSQYLDGVIILSGTIPTSGGRSIADAGIPVVSVCLELEDHRIQAVHLNDEESGAAQMNHMLELGHRSFMYLTGPVDGYSQIRRSLGITRAAALAGLNTDDFVRYAGNYTFESGAAAAKLYLDLEVRPTAVICANDEMAIGFMKAARRANLKVPEDVSVIGFDGIEFSLFCEPTLTTIVQPRYLLGKLGAQALVRGIHHGQRSDENKIVLKGELRLGQSTMILTR
jgi:LacI family repressor for deo operon, udp, cdd, tsx, nupC, and nupG